MMSMTGVQTCTAALRGVKDLDKQKTNELALSRDGMMGK